MFEKRKYSDDDDLIINDKITPQHPKPPPRLKEENQNENNENEMGEGMVLPETGNTIQN